jgi:hypothetical protein
MKSDQTDFEEDLVKKAATDVIENYIYNNSQVTSYFMADNIDNLSQCIVNDLMKELLKTKKQFKYSVTCFIQQKTGAAVNYGSSFLAEDGSDGVVTLIVNDNPYIDLIITVVGVKITQK